MSYFGLQAPGAGGFTQPIPTVTASPADFFARLRNFRRVFGSEDLTNLQRLRSAVPDRGRRGRLLVDYMRRKGAPLAVDPSALAAQVREIVDADETTYSGASIQDFPDIADWADSYMGLLGGLVQGSQGFPGTWGGGGDLGAVLSGAQMGGLADSSADNVMRTTLQGYARYCVATAAVTSTAGATASENALDMDYDGVYLGLSTGGGAIDKVTAVVVDGNTLTLGETGVAGFPASDVDVDLEPNLFRLFPIGRVNRSISVSFTAAGYTSNFTASLYFWARVGRGNLSQLRAAGAYLNMLSAIRAPR